MRREADVARREAAVAAREAALAERLAAAPELLAAADERDAVSDARDVAANKRGHDLDLAEMLASEAEYGQRWPERRDAALDRGHAKEDRTSSHHDRTALTEGDVEHDPEET